MSYTKTIVCLANSDRPSGRCVAGREVTSTGFGPWVRPVSARPTQEVSEKERCYKNGREPSVLDIVAIVMDRPEPQGHQRENHVIDAKYRWERRDVVSWPDLQKAVEDPKGPLWINGTSSSNGHNDRVPEDRLSSLNRSLYLVRPDNTLMLTVTLEGVAFESPRRKIRAEFDVSGCSYRIAVTDPWVKRQYPADQEGEALIEDALLCVSLAEAFHGFAYKLAAAVITPQRARN